MFKPSIKWKDTPEMDKPTDGATTEKVSPPSLEQDNDAVGGLELEVITLADEIMAIIAPRTEPFLANFMRKGFPEDQTEA